MNALTFGLMAGFTKVDKRFAKARFVKYKRALYVRNQQLCAELLQLARKTYVIRIIMGEQQGRDRFHLNPGRLDRL